MRLIPLEQTGLVEQAHLRLIYFKPHLQRDKAAEQALDMTAIRANPDFNMQVAV